MASFADNQNAIDEGRFYASIFTIFNFSNQNS